MRRASTRTRRLLVLSSQREIGGLVGLLFRRRRARRGLLRVRDLVHETLRLGEWALEVGAELRRVAENVDAEGAKCAAGNGKEGRQSADF